MDEHRLPVARLEVFSELEAPGVRLEYSQVSFLACLDCCGNALDDGVVLGEILGALKPDRPCEGEAGDEDDDEEADTNPGDRQRCPESRTPSRPLTLASGESDVQSRFSFGVSPSRRSSPKSCAYQRA